MAFRILKPVAAVILAVVAGCQASGPGEAGGVADSEVAAPMAEHGEMLATASEPIMYAHFINVGQGDATLLEFPCGAILIDAGAQDQAHIDVLVDHLDRFFDRRGDLDDTLESVIITHNHPDHTDALRAVAESFTIHRYIDNGQTTGRGTANPRWIRDNAQTDGRDIRIREIFDTEITSLPHKEGLTGPDIDPLSCPLCDPEVTILSGQVTENPGWRESDFADKNNHSLVIRVDFDESSFLFTGDLEEPAIATLINWYEGTDMLDVDVYQVGHHGSHNGTDSSLVEAMTPEIAVISVGSWDYGRDESGRFNTYNYGHPRRVVIDLLSDGIPGRRSQAITAKVADGVKRFDDYRVTKRIYATAWDGNIRIRATLDDRKIVTRNN